MIIADIMHPDGNILLRPEYGLFDGRWNAIACRNLTVLKSIQAIYTPGRDIIISTGIIDARTKPEYQSQLLAAVTIEPRQHIANSPPCRSRNLRGAHYEERQRAMAGSLADFVPIPSATDRCA